ncbi:KpsF/GutQ family protein, partial [Magnaporthiopsis poae ATCC 64411]
GEEEEGGYLYESDGDFGAELDGRAWTATSLSGGEDTRDREEQHGAPVVVLPAPIPVSEVDCLGIAAPTASTTVALALGDALAVAIGRELHGGVEGVASVFARNHPGGAIGAAMSASRGTPSSSRFDDSRPETPG